MDRSTKIIILIIVGVLAIGGIVFMVLATGGGGGNTNTPANKNQNNNQNQPTTSNSNNNQNTNTVVTPPPVAVAPPKEVPKQVQSATELRNIAVLFAERLGSYSNQTNFKNFADLEPFCSGEVYTFLQGDYKQRVTKTFPQEPGYYGVSSKVTAYKVVSESESETKVTLEVSKTESGTRTATTAAVLALTLTKNEGGWKVTYLKWQ